MLRTLAATAITRGRQIKTLKKVIAWRIVSILLTYVFTFAYTGNIKTATAFTIFLHAILLIANYVFEIVYEKMIEANREKTNSSRV
jgi:uncharacterized membrane protein